MSGKPWVPLQVLIDDDALETIYAQPFSVRVDVVHAIDRYLETGDGGPPVGPIWRMASTRAGRPAGSMPPNVPRSRATVSRRGVSR